MPRSRRVAVAALIVSSVAAVCGCRPVPLAFPASLNSQRPEERIRAAKTAVDWPYRSAAERHAVLEMLVARLDDEDDAVRFFAILALEKLTGTRHGYVYYAPASQRVRAMASWRRYLARLQEAGEGSLVEDSAGAGPLAGPGGPEGGGGASREASR